MKTFFCSLCPKFLIICGIITAPSIAIAADVVLQKAPPLTVEQAPAYPENLARYHLGAEIQAIPQNDSTAKLQLSSGEQDRNTAEAALLCDDPSTGYRVPVGKSSILVSLANIENIQSVSFLNDGTQGEITIATSNANLTVDSPQWHPFDKRALAQGAATIKVGPAEAKYVKINFDVTQVGRIAAFGVYATPALSDFTMPRPRKVSFEDNSAAFALINYNFTDLHAKARGLYVSSGDLKQVNNMIDDQPATAYQFAAGDTAPTAVIDLGRERTLQRISAVYAPQSGSIDFYVLDTLPVARPNETAAAADRSTLQKISNTGQSADLPGSLKISDKEFAAMKSVGSIANTDKGRGSVDFAPTTGRYLILRWRPATAQDKAFSVAQVAVFGRPKQSDVARGSDSGQATERRELTDGKQLADGKNILDNKDIPAEGPEEAEAPAEGPPPGLPAVPPFTFIPQAPPGTAPEVPPVSP